MAAAPMWPRSLVSVAIATCQPPLRGPSRASGPTATSSRNTSSKWESPVIWRSGRASMPAARMSTRKYEIPAWRRASGSVRAMQMARSATLPFEHHTFWPVRRQPPVASSGSALVASEARSLPAPGSLNSWHHTTSPVAVPGRWAARCSSVP